MSAQLNDVIYAERQGIGGTLTLAEVIALVSGGTQNVFIQETEPIATPPFIWYKTNAQGKIIDIRQSV